jgi:hypothetical protein
MLSTCCTIRDGLTDFRTKRCPLRVPHTNGDTDNDDTDNDDTRISDATPEPQPKVPHHHGTVAGRHAVGQQAKEPSHLTQPREPVQSVLLTQNNCVA